MDNLPLVPVPFLRWALVLVSASAIATRDAASISVVHAIIVGRAGLIRLDQTDQSQSQNNLFNRTQKRETETKHFTLFLSFRLQFNVLLVR